VTRRIHQVLVGAADGDAITSMAFTLRHRLRAIAESEIFAHYLPADGAIDVHPLHSLPSPGPSDVLVYHASYGEPAVTETLLARSEPIVLVHHNITPGEYFESFEPRFAEGLRWGRHELDLLRDRVVLAVADSTFNADDLAAHGYHDVHVIPAGVTPARLTRVAPDPAFAAAITAHFPDGYVIAVSQVLPHKRFEDLIEAMHLAQWVHGVRAGLMIVGRPRLPTYEHALRRFAVRLRVEPVLFTGAITDAQLSAAFRMASLHVTTSAHEGLAIPPLEAMAFGVPVIARAAGALAETIGDAGVVLPSDAGAGLLGEAIVAVLRDDTWRERMRRRGYARVDRLGTDDPGVAFTRLLAGAIG
jgi:glycosyltransferase involved in cell wall biosynthesis